MSRTSGALLGVALQSVLYGMYLVTTVASTYAIHHIRARSIKPNRVLLGVSVSLFISVTLHCGLGIASVVEEIIGHEGAPSGSLSDFERISAVSLTRLGTFYLVNFLTDGLLTYRLYVIYLRDLRIIALPVLVILVSVVSVFLQLILSNQYRDWDSEVDENVKLELVLAPLTLSISAFVCIYSTSFIIYRILRDGYAFRQFRTKNPLGPAVYIMIESAFVYTVLIIIFLVLYVVCRCHGFFFLLTFIIPPFIGLNYSLVLTHVGLGLTNISQTYTLRLSAIHSSGLQRPIALDRIERPIIIVTTEGPAVERDSADGGEITDGPDGKDTEGAKSQRPAVFNGPTALV